MPHNTHLKNQITELSSVAANELYSLALYSVQSAPLADSLAVDAFAGACKSLPRKTDGAQFKVLCAGRLYAGAKKALQTRADEAPLPAPAGSPASAGSPAPASPLAPIHRLLYALEFEERFLLLLFMHRYTRGQIAQIMALPQPSVQGRIEELLAKTRAMWHALS